MDRTIVIVDDHVEFRRAARAVLQADCVVGEAWDGATALTEVERLSPAIVLAGHPAARRGRLRGLRDRTEAMGGRLHIDSPPGEGTRLEALLPTDGLRSPNADVLRL